MVTKRPTAGPIFPPSTPEAGPIFPPSSSNSTQAYAGRGTPISQIAAYQSTTGPGVFLRALDHLNYTTPVKASRHQDQAALTAALKKQRPEVLRLQALGSNLRMLVARAPLTTALLVTQTKGACMLTVGDQTHAVSYPAAQQKAALQHVQDQLRLGELSLPFIAAEAEDPSWAFVHALGLHRLPTQRFTHTLEVMAIVNDVVVAPVHQLKHALNIPRPDVSLPKLRPWLPTPPHASFPSGHAMYAHAVAVVLATLTGAHDPKALTQLASAVAQRRELAGLHTALDTAMGQTLGQAIGQWLVKEATKSRAPELAAWRTLFVMAGLEWSGREVA